MNRYTHLLFKILLLCATWIIDSTVCTSQIINKIDQRLLSHTNDERLAVIIVMQDQADISAAKHIKGKDNKAQYVFNTLSTLADSTQKNIIAWLKENNISFRPYYIVNMLSAKTTLKNIENLANRDDVKYIIEDSPYTMLQPIDNKTESKNGHRAPLWNISKILAPDVWNLGFTGQNIIIGGQDTGYDWDVPAIQSQYRGWNGSSANHDYNWHDAIHEDNPMSPGINSCGFDSPIPCDDHNHGTHTMGTMVGGLDNTGKEIGVAPQAKWIGCRNMENGYGTLSTYTECFEWFLAPYPVSSNSSQGDPTKMPHIINNSWGCPPIEGCNITNWGVMETAIHNLTLAGCLVVVSAGNDGPNCNTVANPAAIFADSYSVGATNSSDNIANFSSRGAVQVDGSLRLKPDISAPGVSVYSCIRNGNYATYSGTSMAGPHIAGAAALLISANNTLEGEVDHIKILLNETALGLTSSQTCNDINGNYFPNNTYGHGRINILAAVERSLNENYVPLIKVDQLGYLPHDQKIAVLSDPIIGYNNADTFAPSSIVLLKEASSHKVVYSSAPQLWNTGATDPQSGDKVWHFDFSSFNTPGSYYIADQTNGLIRSSIFNIDYNIFDSIQEAAFKPLYYQRCGTSKTLPFVPSGYLDISCHTSDLNCRFVADPTNTSLEKNLSGGWHDAGDYNKYVNFSMGAVLDLLWAYEMHPQAWTSDAYTIPESNNGIPDLLDELKYELDWILKMQDSDGGVHAMVGTLDYASASPPSMDLSQRYYGPKSTSATLSAATMMAFASRQFAKINSSIAQNYATLLASKALTAYNWTQNNPNTTFYNTSINPVLGAGEQEVDTYHREMRQLCAAIYIYAITHDPVLKAYIDANYQNAHMMLWNFVYPFEMYIQNALLFYAHLRDIDPTIAQNIKNTYRTSIENHPDNLPAQINELDPYLSYIHPNNIVWGSNSVKCAQANMLTIYAHYDLNPSNNSLIAQSTPHYIHYIHGVNPNGLCYLTNMANLGLEKSINTIYHNWFNNGHPDWDDVRTSTYGPPSGFLSGGPNSSYTLDACCPNNCGSPQNNSLCLSLSPPLNQPAYKSYYDWNTGWPQNAWQITENAIYYQSAYLSQLSALNNTSKKHISDKNIIQTHDADIFLSTSLSGIVLTSPNQLQFKITINPQGQLQINNYSTPSGENAKIINASIDIQHSNKGILLNDGNQGLWQLRVDKSGQPFTSSIANIPSSVITHTQGDLIIDSPNNGIILKDSDGICYLIQVTDAGLLYTIPTLCHP